MSTLYKEVTPTGHLSPCLCFSLSVCLSIFASDILFECPLFFNEFVALRLDFHSEPDSFTISLAENELHVNKNSDNIEKDKKTKNIIKMQTRKFKQTLNDIRIERINFGPILGHNFSLRCQLY